MSRVIVPRSQVWMGRAQRTGTQMAKTLGAWKNLPEPVRVQERAAQGLLFTVVFMAEQQGWLP